MPYRILVVEDNQDEAELLRGRLERSGFLVEVATNAFAALSVLESFEADVALVDIGLPGFDGLQLTEAIRTMPSIGNMWIFATTGRSDDAEKSRARAAGIDMYFIKPLVHEDLGEVLRALPARPLDFTAAPFDRPR